MSTQLPWFGHPNITCRRVKIMKVLTTQLSPSSYYFFPLRTQYSSQRLISWATSFCILHSIWYNRCNLYNNKYISCIMMARVIKYISCWYQSSTFNLIFNVLLNVAIMLLGWLHLGRHVQAESSKTQQSTGCCSIIQGSYMLSTMSCPRFDFTSCMEHPRMMDLTFICGSRNDGFSSCFIYVIPQSRVLAVFPSPWFLVWRFTFHIPFRWFVTSLLLQHYIESQLLKPSLWHTLTCRHTCKHTHTPSVCTQHTHTHTHTQTWTDTYSH